MEQQPVEIAVIGGSGLYHMAGLNSTREVSLSTPFGSPSDSIMIGDLYGTPVAFLARHGRGHVYLPHEVPYRANIFALKTLGVKYIIAVSACGSLREDYAPGHIVIPDQLFDATKGRRESTFFGEGLALHIGVPDPFCPVLREMLIESITEVGGQVHRDGAFITIEGPRFSTKAESNVYRSWGMSVIGMTTSPEAFLAREAEICYAVMAHVTDYDVWHETEEPVSVDIVVRTLSRNVEVAQGAIGGMVKKLAQHHRDCGCSNALAEAIITDRRKINRETRQRLALLVDKYLD
nr:S-methyl-5'-thioadenosine phosphorylase [Anaerolineae bacterium]